MAKITYVDQYPNTANTGQVGTSGNPYDKMHARCIVGTVCVCSQNVYGTSGVCGAAMCSGSTINACSHICTTCGDVCACVTGGVGGNVYAQCCVCAAGNVVSGGGCVVTDAFYYSSQGCICVCSCLIDCNGSEILGGGGGLWWDGTGYICPCNSCPVCADCVQVLYQVGAGCFCSNGYGGCSGYIQSGSYTCLCFCGGIIVGCS